MVIVYSKTVMMAVGMFWDAAHSRYSVSGCVQDKRLHAGDMSVNNALSNAGMPVMSSVRLTVTSTAPILVVAQKAMYHWGRLVSQTDT